MARSTSSNQTSAQHVRGGITKAKNAVRATTQNLSSTTRNNITNNKQKGARRQTRSSVHIISKTRGRSSTNTQKRSTLGSNTKSRSSSRTVHALNNSAVRHGRSTNASRGTARAKKTIDGRKKKTNCITGRLNNKKKNTIRGNNNNNNNNQQRRPLGRDQQKKKKNTTTTSSLIAVTPSSMIRPDDDFHRESNFGTNE
ncbi:unnamed protein product [Rotaria magnacalcarata]|uniref:Uncharacterized protein n=7 Tax=Rotaria magnacalcarata TaxID=392030 RepID=A0A815JZF1_9BILA|nr:unnamed protein product [Rotaria magnacalcarata]CAF1615708.1 unnamed protein product [Rotaria magnacalcarata]